MSEISVAVYFKHDEPATHQKLVQLFELSEDDEADSFNERFCAAADSLADENGAEIAHAYLQDLSENLREGFYPEDIESSKGFCIVSFLCGGGGDRFAARTVRFVDALCPGIRVQAWGMGDDDPWEFWFRRIDGQTIRFDNEPYDGNDKRAFGTIYRWWHDGLPDGLKEGMLNDEPLDDEDGPDVSDEEYQKWLEGIEPTSDLEQSAEEVVGEEMVEALTGLLGSLFSGGSSKKRGPDPKAFDASEMTEETVRAVFEDIDQQESQQSVDGVMKHMSRDMKGTMINQMNGKEVKSKLTYSLYRMALKMVMRTDTGFQSDQEIQSIDIDDGVARVRSKAKMRYKDPASGDVVDTNSEEDYILEIIDGKVQVTTLDSRELVS